MTLALTVERPDFGFADISWALSPRRHRGPPTAADPGSAEMPGFLDLTFLCTDYRFRGRGAGKALVHAATEAARAEGLPVFLESTTDAVPFYERLGFATIGGFHMSLPDGAPSTEGVTIYQETLMVLENTQDSCETSKYCWLRLPKPR